MNGRERQLKKRGGGLTSPEVSRVKSSQGFCHSTCVGSQEAAGAPVGASSGPGQTRALSALCVPGNFS